MPVGQRGNGVRGHADAVDLAFEVRTHDGQGGPRTPAPHHDDAHTVLVGVGVAARSPARRADLHEPTEFFAHRQWVGRGVRHDFEIHNSGTDTIERLVSLRVGPATSRTCSRVKAGERRHVVGVMLEADDAAFGIVHPGTRPGPPGGDRHHAATGVVSTPGSGRLRMGGAPLHRGVRRCVSVTFEPVWHARRSQLLCSPRSSVPKVGRRSMCEPTSARRTGQRAAARHDR